MEGRHNAPRPRWRGGPCSAPRKNTAVRRPLCLWGQPSDPQTRLASFGKAFRCRSKLFSAPESCGDHDGEDSPPGEGISPQKRQLVHSWRRALVKPEGKADAYRDARGNTGDSMNQRRIRFPLTMWHAWYRRFDSSVAIACCYSVPNAMRLLRRFSRC